MNLSPSLDLIWRLAANEMAAGQFKEIEPEHFCMALLKFAELPAAVVEADERAKIAKTVAVDIELVREALHKYEIESTSVRHRLRGKLGKGDTPRHDGQIHRSAASRALFESAANLARETGCDTVTPLHLLTALMQSPTAVIVRIVLANGASPPPPAALPLLDKHGRDLAKEAAEGRLTSRTASEAPGKAVLQVLLQKERKSILLVTDNNGLAEDIAISVALAIAAKKPPPGLKGRRLIDVAAPSRKGLRVSPGKETNELEQLRVLLEEATSHPEIILLVPDFEAEDKTFRGGQWAGLLRQTLMKGTVQLICRVTPVAFKEHLCKDQVWKRQAEAIWLERAAVGSVPREL